MIRISTADLPDAIARCKRRLETETWAGRRRFRLEGVSLLTGPRDRLMPAVHNAPNVRGQPDPFRFVIRPAYHPDPNPDPPFFQALIESASRVVRSRLHRA